MKQKGIGASDQKNNLGRTSALACNRSSGVRAKPAGYHGDTSGSLSDFGSGSSSSNTSCGIRHCGCEQRQERQAVEDIPGDGLR
jgi:hypothetical protein